VYRYDRVTGWDELEVPGWNLGNATAESPAYALAVNPGGTGLMVGKGGRIADITRGGVALDPAAVECSATPARCGGGVDLHAAAVAPDGSALVGGDERTLLWRPAGGPLAPVAPPLMSPAATITGISMPTATRAWLTTNTGEVFAGSLDSSGWTWILEDLDANGGLMARDANDQSIPLRAIALDGQGDGFAVGDHGVILQRSRGSWIRLFSGFSENLTSVSVDPSGRGALVGGAGGLVLTWTGGRFEPAQESDFFDPRLVADGAISAYTGGVAGLALLPGDKPGQVEAWAVEDRSV
jgi:hypothetical protein